MISFAWQWENWVIVMQYLLSGPWQEVFADPYSKIPTFWMGWYGLLFSNGRVKIKTMLYFCLGNHLKATQRTKIRHIDSIFNKKGNIYNLEPQSRREYSGDQTGAMGETKMWFLYLDVSEKPSRPQFSKVNDPSWGVKSTIPWNNGDVMSRVMQECPWTWFDTKDRQGWQGCIT